ncbi:MAG: S49 family peptidase [Gammaproteobacteria bacterium]|nr:S49 family peptidase [Gammaproteobacteria bacterium]
MSEPTANQDPQQASVPFEQGLVNAIAREFLREQRAARRWGIFFKLLLAVYLFSFLLIYIAGELDLKGAELPGKRHTALVEVEGIIASDTEASADKIVAGLRDAFEDGKTAGVIVRINSPGGSPVQAGYVNDEILRLRKKYPAIPLYAVISDLCASGGYYIATAADKIYADKASIVGSIGVIMAGFGFVETLQKLGIERRVLHAGENKGLLDPFAPLREEEVQHVDGLLQNVYSQFIEVVKQGRGKRLKEDPTLFSGLIWSGEQSVELGLVDGLGSAGYVAREIIGVEEIVDFTHREGYLDRFARRIGTTAAERLQSLDGLKLY